MITFVVTTYNLEDWLLRRCLKSIVEQDITDYEIIVVDDESDLSPQHIVDEFAAQANIHLYIQKHSRQGAARNLALNHAQGQWIQFVDGDDYLLPHTVQPCLTMAEANDLDLLMFGYREVGEQPDEHNHPLPTGDFPLNITTGDNYMLHNNLFGSCCTLLFRRALCTDASYGEPLRFSEHIYIEDEEFITKLTWRAHRMAKVDSIVYAYYQRPGSTTHNRSHEHTDELFRNYFVVLERLLQFKAAAATHPHEGLTRKIRFFAIDILRRSLRQANWQERWIQSSKQLASLGLYPIPRARYSWKYRLFRLLSTCSIGRRLLRIIETR
jgi:glycosyltransferase involved in cell wall biosynthesis